MGIARGKTICFIDNANIYHGQRSAGWRIDWERFARWLNEGGEIWQTYFFASQGETPQQPEINFYQFLREELRWDVSLYELGKKTITCENCGSNYVANAEKGVDVGLAIKMLMLGVNQAFDTAILVAGDRDYLETVQFVKGLGLRVEVISWREGVSDALETESSAPVIFLDDLKNEIRKQ
jgi:uncharacterized LabA/DUF88 family protein